MTALLHLALVVITVAVLSVILNSILLTRVRRYRIIIRRVDDKLLGELDSGPPAVPEGEGDAAQ